jgi:hypothetical protein
MVEMIARQHSEFSGFAQRMAAQLHESDSFYNRLRSSVFFAENSCSEMMPFSFNWLS